MFTIVYKDYPYRADSCTIVDGRVKFETVTKKGIVQQHDYPYSQVAIEEQPGTVKAYWEKYNSEGPQE